MKEQACFAAGCFWGVQQRFDERPGVLASQVGYIGGTTPNPSYQEVCRDNTGHAEAVLLDFDPAQVSFQQLLELFFELHDPTQLNRQGPDVGSQYRSAVFVLNQEQRRLVQELIQKKQSAYNSPIVTQIEDFTTFTPAEDYHQKYYLKKSCSLSS